MEMKFGDLDQKEQEKYIQKFRKLKEKYGNKPVESIPLSNENTSYDISKEYVQLNNYQSKSSIMDDELLQKLYKFLPDKPSLYEVRDALIQTTLTFSENIPKINNIKQYITMYDIWVDIIECLYPKPKLEYVEEEECCICLENKDVMKILKCGHRVCVSCGIKLTKDDDKIIKPINLYKNILCPICRAVHTFYDGKLIDDHFSKIGQMYAVYGNGEKTPISFTQLQHFTVKYKKHTWF